MAESNVVKFGDFYCKTTFIDEDMIFTVLSGNHGFTGLLDQSKVAEIQEKMAGKFDNIFEMARNAFSEPRKKYGTSKLTLIIKHPKAYLSN